MATIKIQKVRSTIGCPQVQKDTMLALGLGLRKMNAIVEHEATPAILGMVNKIKHLVKVID